MIKNIKVLNSPVGVGLLNKALQIFDLFQNDTPSFSQGEISKATGMPKSTVNRLVKFLTDKKYLSLLEGQNRYSLGPAVIDLGVRASLLFDMRAACRPVLRQLSNETGETVLLTSILSSGDAVRCVDQIESTIEGLRVFEQIGSIFPLHAGASPKAVLAVLAEDEQEKYLTGRLDSINKNTTIDIKKLRNELIETRQKGFCISNGETYDGVVGIAAAFIWPSGSPAGSLAVALPSQRASSNNVELIGKLIIEGCKDLNTILSSKSHDIITKAA